MTNRSCKTITVLLLSITLAILLAAVAQSVRPIPDENGHPSLLPAIEYNDNDADASPLLVNNMLQVRPSDYPTPVPLATPIATLGPTRGPVVSSNPAVTPPPAGRVNPTPLPTFYGKFRPGAVNTGPYSAPAVQKPLPTLIPQFPAKGMPMAPVNRARTR